MTTKTLNAIAIAIITLIISQSTFAAAYHGIITKGKQQEMTPQEALERLQEGNQRFVDNKMKNRQLLIQAYKTATGQHPIAVVLNCIDSRTPPEMVFDQGIGDIFAIRIAGNIINNDILGSMEFGTQITGAKLIAVVGHTSCGAVRGACQNAELGHLTALLNKIKPAVTEAKSQTKLSDCSDSKLINQAAEDNVKKAIQQIKEQSPVIAKLVANNKVIIVGGVQDIKTGAVKFF